MKRALLVGALALSACGGGSDFSGTWAGNLVDTGACSDNSGVNTSDSTAFVITQAGKDVTIQTSGNCGALSGVAAGNVVTLNAKTCSPYVSGPYAIGSQMQGGTLTLSDGVIHFATTLYETADGPTTATCTVNSVGDFHKQ